MRVGTVVAAPLGVGVVQRDLPQRGRLLVRLIGSGEEVAVPAKDLAPFDPQAPHPGLARGIVERARRTAETLADDGHWPTCSHCGDGGRLVLCATCADCYHTGCVAPALEQVPEQWRCAVCRGGRSAAEVGREMSEALRAAIDDLGVRDTLGHFAVPVSVEYIVPDYAARVEHPMDLMTMRQRLQRGCLTSFADLRRDAGLMVANCAAFNKDSDPAMAAYAEEFRASADASLAAAEARHASLPPLTFRAFVRGAAVPKPFFAPAAAMTFTAPLRVAVYCADPAARLHYTTDGSEPTPKSAEYTAPLLVAVSIKLRCIAVDADGVESNTAAHNYTVHVGDRPPPEKAPAPAKERPAKRDRAEGDDDVRRADWWPLFLQKAIAAAPPTAAPTYQRFAEGGEVSDGVAARIRGDAALFREVNADLIATL